MAQTFSTWGEALGAAWAMLRSGKISQPEFRRIVEQAIGAAGQDGGGPRSIEGILQDTRANRKGAKDNGE